MAKLNITTAPAAAVAAAGLTLLLSACASASGVSRYAEEYARLEQNCRARDGILTPAHRVQTGNPAADNYCEIRGGGTRIAREPSGR